MFTTQELMRYADVLWWGLKTARTNPYQPGETVLVRFHRPAIPLAEMLYRSILEKGLNPVIRLEPTPEMEHSFYSLADDRQIAYIAAGETSLYKTLNGSVFCHAPEEMTHLKDISPGRIAETLLHRKRLRDILRKREAAGDLSWTLCVYPTERLAQAAGMTFEEYRQQIVQACFLDDPDPVRRWQEIYDNAQTVKAWLNSLAVDYFHIESRSCDLKVVLGQRRRWAGISGRNIPSFEIFVSPDWRGAHGTYHADQPSYRSGQYVEGVTLKFHEGRLEAVSSRQGEAFVRTQLAMDAGASRVGEFSLTDRRFSRINRFMAETLFDENYGGQFGNCHIALGSSYANTFDGQGRELTAKLKASLGFNESALHWDFVNTESKRVSARLKNGDRMLIYEDGQFAI